MPSLVMRIPAELQAVGTAGAVYEPVARVEDVAAGTMLRVTRGDLDLLIAHTANGICVIDDRCPHMAAPLSIGMLEGCLVACPLHKGQFDLSNGGVVQFPTTGGLDADGGYHAPWTPADSPGKTEPTDLKSRARAATRIRRLRYYPVRVNGSNIEVVLPR